MAVEGLLVYEIPFPALSRTVDSQSLARASLVLVFRLIGEHVGALIALEFCVVQLVHRESGHLCRMVFVVARRAILALLQPLVHAFLAGDSFTDGALLQGLVDYICADRAFESLVQWLDGLLFHKLA